MPPLFLKWKSFETNLREIVLSAICADSSETRRFCKAPVLWSAKRSSALSKVRQQSHHSAAHLHLLPFSLWTDSFLALAGHSKYLFRQNPFYLPSEFPSQGDVYFLSCLLSSCVEIWFIHTWTCKEASSHLGGKVKTRRTRTTRSSRPTWEQWRKRRKWHPWAARQRWVSRRERYGQKCS